MSAVQDRATSFDRAGCLEGTESILKTVFLGPPVSVKRIRTWAGPRVTSGPSGIWTISRRLIVGTCRLARVVRSRMRLISASTAWSVPICTKRTRRPGASRRIQAARRVGAAPDAAVTNSSGIETSSSNGLELVDSARVGEGDCGDGGGIGSSRDEGRLNPLPPPVDRAAPAAVDEERLEYVWFDGAQLRHHAAAPGVGSGGVSLGRAREDLVGGVLSTGSTNRAAASVRIEPPDAGRGGRPGNRRCHEHRCSECEQPRVHESPSGHRHRVAWSVEGAAACMRWP